jgi:hypothetical protein
MTGKIIAQKVESRRSARLIQQKDGSALCWVCSGTRPHKQTVFPVHKDKVEETIRDLGLEPVQVRGRE